MRDFRTLKILDRFEKIFTLFGVDYKIMRKILQVKFMLDQRRVPTIFSQHGTKKGKKDTDSNGYLKSLWIYVLFGLIMIPFIVMGNNYIFQMSTVFGIFMFLVSSSMISDFSSVLLDIRDRNILYPKPIDRRTISTAKMIHIFMYLSFLTLAIIGIPLIVGLFTKGILFTLIFVITIIFIDLFIIVITALLYMFILKFFDGEKLKDLINYVQIALSLAIMIGYQLLVRSFEFINFTIVLEPKWWHFSIFPMWYGAIFETLMKAEFSTFYLFLSACGLVIPVISFLIYLKLLPTFEKNLQKLSVHSKGKMQKPSKLKEFFLKIICRTAEERAFFRFASLMMKNERDFKLKVYPSLGFSIVIPFIFLINVIQLDSPADLSNSSSYFTIYFSLIIIPTVVIMLKHSGKYKGAWIYKSSPLKNLQPIFSGTMKAFILKLFFPLYLLLSVSFIWIFGIDILVDLIVVFVNACIYAIVCFLMLKKTLPFSESFDTANQNGGAKVFVLMLIVVIFAGLHFGSTFIPFGVYLYLLFAIICLVLVWRSAFKMTWANISD